MASAEQSGREYERHIRTKLNTIYTTISTTAEFGVGPDLTIPAIQQKNKGKKILVELKTTTGSDFGQKTITHDGNKWIAKDNKNELPEYRELYDSLFKDYNLSDKIQTAWNLPNNTLTASDIVDLVETKQFNKILYYEKKYQTATNKKDPFPTKTLVTGTSIIESILTYYNSKKVYYIQIKGKGFYILKEDKENLNGILKVNIPKFNPSFAKLILRGKPSTSGRTYRPVITFKSSDIDSSPYNLEDLSFIKTLYDNF